jgi:hypothetical protein
MMQATFSVFSMVIQLMSFLVRKKCLHLIVGRGKMEVLSINTMVGQAANRIAQTVNFVFVWTMMILGNTGTLNVMRIQE